MIAVGTLVQWYEIEILEEYLNSLAIAASNLKDKIIIDLCLSTNQDLEKIDTSKTTLREIEVRFNSLCKKLVSQGYDIRSSSVPELLTIADYRRIFNSSYANRVDVLFWGETDSLIPSQAFESILLLNGATGNTNKWVGFFATCKMWDDSWKVVEHPKLTNFLADPYAWYGTRSYMAYDKMEEINQGVEDIGVEIHNYFKFNGCGLFFSSDIIKSGINIPESVFFTHEDTAFMNMLNLVDHGNKIPFYVIKNILLVHNREHPKKRMYILNEAGNDMNAQRRSNDWYNRASEFSKLNAHNFMNQGKVYSWKDVWNHQ